MNNGCPKCEEIKVLCLDCQLFLADAHVDWAMQERERLEKLKLEQEKQKIKEQENESL